MPPCSVCLFFECITMWERLSLESPHLLYQGFPHMSFRKKPPPNKITKTLNHIHHLYYISDRERSFPAMHFTSILLTIVFSFPNQKVNLAFFRELFQSLINFSVMAFFPSFFLSLSPCYKAYILILHFPAHCISQCSKCHNK